MMSILTVRTLGLAGACGLMLLAACQSQPTRYDGQFDASKAIPGAEAAARYAYLTQAIEDFKVLLATPSASFDQVPFASELLHLQARTGSAERRLPELARTQLADHAPYRLVSADPHNGRIEFRSNAKVQHLAIYIEPSDASDLTDDAYVVTDMVTQVTLRDLLAAGSESDLQTVSSSYSAIGLAARRVDGVDDAALLSQLDGMTIQERDREDVLRLRAILSLRLSRPVEASHLVQQGIVRYPKDVNFFVLAEHLLDTQDGEGDKALKRLMNERFTRAEVSASRRSIASALAR